jgi:tyrosyl-tRNA synthetase
MPEIKLDCGAAGRLGIAHVLSQAELVASTSEAFRMIRQGAVRIDSERAADTGLELAAGHTYVCQVGKRRFAKITLIQRAE